MPATVVPAGDVLLQREDIARAWRLAGPHLDRARRAIGDAFPTAETELMAIALTIALRTVAETTGYHAGFATLFNEIVSHDDRFRWRLIDCQN